MGWHPAQLRPPAAGGRQRCPHPVSLWTFLAQVTGAGGPVFAPGVPRRRWRGTEGPGEGSACPPGAPAAAAPRWSTFLVWAASSLPSAQHPVCRGGSSGRPTDRASPAEAQKRWALVGTQVPQRAGGVVVALSSWLQGTRSQASYPPRLVAPAVFTHGRLASRQQACAGGPEVAQTCTCHLCLC